MPDAQLSDLDEALLAVAWLLVQGYQDGDRIDTWALGAVDTAVELLQRHGWMDRKRRFTPKALAIEPCLPHKE